MKEINSTEFDTEVIRADGKVLVDFNADWCGPCQMMKPVLEEFATEHSDIKVVGVNIDDNEELAEQYEVGTIPCLVVFENGAEQAREVGVISPKKLVKLVGIAK